METQVGLELCTAGRAEVLTVKGQCVITAGMLIVRSPIFPMLSPRHFADIIRQESHYSPMEWINMVTVNQAKNLLRQPDMLVKQVADELGFPEQFTFRKYFKTHTGMSPTEYQNKK